MDTCAESEGMRYKEKRRMDSGSWQVICPKAQDLTVSGREEFYWTNLWIECQLMSFLNACQQRKREKEK